MSTTKEAPTGNLVIDTIILNGNISQHNETLEVEYENTPEVLDAYFAEKTVKEETLADGTYEYTFEKDTDTSSKTKRSNVVTAIFNAITAALSPQNKEVKRLDIQAIIDTKEPGSNWPLQNYAKDSTLTFDQYKKETKIYYKKLSSAPMGYQVYLVAETKNLKGEKVKLKIHEKEEDLKLLKTKDEVLPVLAFAKEDDTTTDTEISDWIEIEVKEKSGKKENGDLFLYKEEQEDKIEVGIKKIQLRPKEDKIKTEGEDASISFEGWQEALYIRENETEEGKKAIEEEKKAKIARDKETDTLLKFDDKAKKLTYPAGDIDAPKTAVIGKVIEYILDIDINDVNYKYKATATEEDKKNIRWSFYVQGDPKATKADKEKTYIEGKSKAGLYTYAKTEVIGEEIKLTIVFDEALVGKKVQIEPFRGSPDLSTKPDFVRTTTIQKVPDPKISIRDKAHLYLRTQCDNVENTDKTDKKFLKGGGFKIETPNTIHIYHDGHISKLNLEALKKVKYRYHNSSGEIYNICECNLFEIDKRLQGVSDDKKNAHTVKSNYDANNVVTYSHAASRKKYTYPDGTIRTYGKFYHPRKKTNYRMVTYKKGSGKALIVKMPDQLNKIINNQKIVYSFSKTARRYSSPELFAGFIGALADVDYTIKSGGSSEKDGTSYPSIKHINGQSIDTNYLGDNTKDQKVIDALHKFGFGEILRGKIQKAFNHTQDGGKLHNNHLHSGEFVAKYK